MPIPHFYMLTHHCIGFPRDLKNIHMRKMVIILTRAVSILATVFHKIRLFRKLYIIIFKKIIFE
jgi:hypothetical protein